MSVTSVNNGPGSSAASAPSAPSSLGKQEFLQLLVTQMQHQDPLNPISDRDFIAQMAQLSALEATNTLSTQVGQMVSTQRQMGALQLVGHDVQFTDASGSRSQGRVSGVRLDGSSPVLLIGKQEVSLDQVQEVL